MDFTFRTNREGLVLGAIGPVGLDISGVQPSCRFLPMFFVVADSEDHAARPLCLQLYLDWATSDGIVVRDGFFDCSCLQSAQAVLGSGRQAL